MEKQIKKVSKLKKVKKVMNIIGNDEKEARNIIKILMASYDISPRYFLE